MPSENQLTVRQPSFSLVPQTLDEAIRFAELIAKTDLVPQQFKGKPGNILVAIQMGLDLGLAPMQALQNIYIVNGRPTVWGDAMLALVKGHRDCEDIQEDDVETIRENKKAICKVKRRGQAWVTRNFSQEDALKATLWGKAGPWKQYPERMLQMRARSWALRDSFPDALKGIQMKEEAQDIPVDVTIEPEPPAASPQPAKASHPDLQTVLDRIAECKATPEVDNVEEKYVLGNGWNEQEWEVLQKALGEQRTTIIKALKATEPSKTPKEPDHGKEFTAQTKLHRKIHIFHKRVKELNPQYGDAWLSQLCQTYGGEGVKEPEDISTIARLEELLEAVEKKGKELATAQKNQQGEAK